VLALVRPEALRVVAAMSSGPAGTVEEIEYRGDRIEYRIRVGGMLVVAVEPALGRRGRVATGDRVGVQFVEDAIHLLAADAAGVRAAPVEPPVAYGAAR
jgi:ABC-type Fe3+/spermidine/putrescine transport system ATPase subunit